MLETLETVNYKVFLATRKNFAWGMGMGMVSVLLMLLAVIPQVNKIFSLRSDVQREKPKLASLEKKLIDLDTISFTPEFAQVDMVNEALPSKKPLLELLASLDRAAQLSTIQINTFEVSPGLVATDSTVLAEALARQSRAHKNGYDQLELKLDIEGEFSQIQQFIQLIERFAPFTTVSSFSLSEQRSVIGTRELQFQPQSSVRMSMVIDTYFFTQSIKVTIDSPLPVIGADAQLVLQELQSLQASGLPEQLEIEGGGLEDPFGIEGFDFGVAN